MLSVCSSRVKSLTPLSACVRVFVCSRACVRGRWTVLNHVPRAPSLLLNCRRAQQLLLGRGNKRARVQTHTHARASGLKRGVHVQPRSNRLRSALSAAIDEVPPATRSSESETLGVPGRCSTRFWRVSYLWHLNQPFGVYQLFEAGAKLSTSVSVFQWLSE